MGLGPLVDEADEARRPRGRGGGRISVANLVEGVDQAVGDAVALARLAIAIARPANAGHWPGFAILFLGLSRCWGPRKVPLCALGARAAPSRWAGGTSYGRDKSMLASATIHIL
ncbi:hypothetical protein V2G26_013760 [Clonostachys chloroleuca]